MDEPIMMEPLCNLLHAIQICLCLAEKNANENEFFNDEMEGSNSAFNKLSSVMKNLVKRMIDTDIEDFYLDKSSDFTNSSVGQKNQLLAEQLLGSYEALMEYAYRSGENKPDNCKDLLALFHKQHSLSEMAKETSGSDKKGAKEKKNDENKGKDQKKNAKDKRKKKPVVYILSLEVLSKLLWNLFCNSSIEDLDCFEDLKHDDSFVSYLISVTSQTVQTYKDQPRAWEHEAEKKASHFGLIARSLVKLYLSVKEGQTGGGTQTQRANNRQAKSQAVSAQGLECLSNIVNMFCKQSTKHLLIFLTALKSGQLSTTTSAVAAPFQEVLKAIIKKFQKLVIQIFSDTDNKHLKDVVPFLTVIQVLGELLQDGYDGDIYKWVTQLCRQQNISDVQVGRALLNLSFDLCHKNKLCMSYYEDVAVAIHRVLGDIEEDVNVDGENEIGVVGQSTAVSCGTLVVPQMLGVINQCSWVLVQLKADSVADTDMSSDQSARTRHEKELCMRLGQWVSACQPIIQTAWPQGSVILSILKMLTQFYNFMSALTKYEISLYSDKAGHMSSYYEKMVKLCAIHLTPKVYSFITYTEVVEREKGAKGKQKAEAGKFQRENKAVPLLILAIEQFERCVLSLSKKSKVNLTDHLKRSTARDFRINAEAVQNALKNNDPSDDENSTINEEAEANDGTRPRHSGRQRDEGLDTQVPATNTSQRPPTAKRGRRKLGPKSGNRLSRC